MERKKLITARTSKHWTLEEAARHLEVNLNTLNRWEKGISAPYAYNVQRLCEVYGLSARELGLDDPPKTSEVAEYVSVDNPWATLIRADLTTHLLATLFEQRSHREVQDQVRHVLEEHDTMNIHNEAYRLTRREALRRLAMFPFVTLLPLESIGKDTRQPSEEVITTCAASIAACWELSKSTEADDLAMVFRAVSAYVTPLEAILKNASQHRDVAKNLLSQCYLFKMVLGWHLESLDKAMEYAQQAMLYSEETNDLALKVTIHKHLSWLYYYARKSKQALYEVEKAAHLLEKTSTPFSPNLYSGVQSTLAVRQAMYGQRQQAITSLRLAQEHFFKAPVDGAFVYVDYERPSLILEDGMAHAHLGLYQTALDSFAQIIDPHTLSSKMPIAERIRIEVLNHQALAFLKSPEKDMEQVIKIWTMAIQEATKLQSTQRFNEAVVIYEIMQAIWPAEKRIEELRELIIS